MITFTAIIKKFGAKGEKSGWTYIDLPSGLAERLNPGVRRAYRVKGMMDGYSFSGVSLTPMGSGDFILPLNAEARKGIKKMIGGNVLVRMELDTSEREISGDLLLCLEDAPDAKVFFQSLPLSQKNYFSNWIEAAKTDATKAKRVFMAIEGLKVGMNYPETIRYFKARKQKDER